MIYINPKLWPDFCLTFNEKYSSCHFHHCVVHLKGKAGSPFFMTRRPPPTSHPSTPSNTYNIFLPLSCEAQLVVEKRKERKKEKRETFHISVLKMSIFSTCVVRLDRIVLCYVFVVGLILGSHRSRNLVGIRF